MQQILFIYTDKRLNDIMTSLRQDVRGLITVAGDFDEGLRLVFEKRPSVIFVQYEISGVSCIAVVTHVKNLLRESAPHVIALLPGTSQKILVGRDMFEGVVTISDEWSKLLADIEDELRKVGGPDFLQESRQGVDTLSPPDDSPLELSPLGEGETFSPPDESEVAPPVEPAEEEGLSPPLRFEPLDDSSEEQVIFAPSEAPGEGSAPPVEVAAPPPESAEPAPPHPPPPFHATKQDSGETREFYAIPEGEVTELPPYEQLFSLRKKSSRPLLRRSAILPLALLVLIALAAAFHLLTGGGPSPSRDGEGKSAPSSPPQKAVQPSGTAGLPPFAAEIPLDRDATAQREGWEIRRSPLLEIRSRHEENRIRALQIISRVPEGIPGEILSQLWDFAGGGFTDGERTVLGDGVSIVLRRNGAGTEAVVYRRDGIPDPIGVVLVFP